MDFANSLLGKYKEVIPLGSVTCQVFEGQVLDCLLRWSRYCCVCILKKLNTCLLLFVANYLLGQHPRL